MLSPNQPRSPVVEGRETDRAIIIVITTFYLNINNKHTLLIIVCLLLIFKYKMT